MATPTRDYPTPVLNDQPDPAGLTFPPDGSGIPFKDGYPPIFPPQVELDLAAMFPTVIPAVEQMIYQAVKDACESHTDFPADGTGITLPAAFNIPPRLSLFAGTDSTYTIPVGQNKGQPVPPIPVVRGWPAFPAAFPAIGVAETTSNEDESEETMQGGFVGDLPAYDQFGNVLATCAYYGEPLTIVVVVELIHENRDERDRLHDQLRGVLRPLKYMLARQSPQIRSVRIDGEKQDLPQDELPRPVYVSLYTVSVDAEALIPTDITLDGAITELDVTVTPTPSE